MSINKEARLNIIIRNNWRVLIFLLIAFIQPIESYAIDAETSFAYRDDYSVTLLDFYDTKRSRPVQVLYYSKECRLENNTLPIVIINHGYKMKNSEYSFIAKELVTLGYKVFSIQQEIDSDPKLPIVGNMLEIRKPFWERGVDNINFALSELKKGLPQYNFNKLIIIGHSNGADIAMEYAERNPKVISMVISLDGLRKPLYKGSKFPILAIGSNDMRPDVGVIPLASELNELKIKLYPMPNAKHIELSDRGPAKTKSKLVDEIIKFIDENANA